MTAADGGGRATLRRRSVSTAAWSLGHVAAVRGLGLAANLVMTRLLAPEAFGLMAMVVTVLTMAEMVSDIGVRQSVARSERGEDPAFLRIAWTVQVVRSAAVAGIVLAAAAGLRAFGPALAAPGSVYADPALPALVAVSALAVLFRGGVSTTLWRAERRLDIGRVTAMEIAAQAATIAAMLGLALTLGASVWVLLAGLLIGDGLRMAASHLIFRDVAMAPAWDRAVAAEMWRFGRWIILSSMATFAVNTGDRFVLGALLDAEVFGLYAIATIWLQVGVTLIDRLSGRVLFAAMAETLRERRAGFARFLARSRLLFDGALAGCFLLTLALAGPLIGLLYTDEYRGAAPILALLSLRFLALRQRPLQQLLVVEGRTRTVAGATALGALAMVAGVPLAWHWGGLGAAVAVAALAPLAAAPVTARAVLATRPGLPVRRDALILAGVSVLAAATWWWTAPALRALGG